jgi:uncharacterized protein
MNEDIEQEKPKRNFPFNNLYLISGLVHGHNKVWMYLFTLSFLMLGYLSFQLAVLFPLSNRLMERGFTENDIVKNPSLIFDSVSLGLDRNIVLLIELGMFVFAFIGFFIGLKYVHQKTLNSILTAYEKFRFKRFWFAFIIWGSLLTASVLLALIFDPESLKFTFNPLGLFFSILIAFALMPIQTGLEELVFRGYLVQGLSQIFKNAYLPLFLTSALFALAHMTNPEVKEFGQVIMFSYYFMFALFMGGLTLLDEGLELAIGIHFANNAISSILVSSQHSVIKAYALFEVTSENPSSEIALWLVMAAITFVIFRSKYKWTNYQLLLK